MKKGLSLPLQNGITMSKFSCTPTDKPSLFSIQGIPIAGMIVSCVIALASLVRLAAGAVFCLIGKMDKQAPPEWAKKGRNHLKQAKLDIAYSVLNALSLGFLGCLNCTCVHLWKAL